MHADLDTARRIASHLLGTYTEQHTGQNNWTFRTPTEILSIPRSHRSRYDRRIAGTTILRQHNIPCPTITRQGEVDGIPYLSMEIVSGTMADRQNIPAARHRSAGLTLHAIHTINVTGYGRLDGNLTGPYTTWRDFVQSYMDESTELLTKTPLLQRKYAAPITNNYRELLPTADTVTESHLLHGDYHLGNMLFDGDDVAGILDLDIITGGDPSWDVGHYCRTFNTNRSQGMVAFLQGYGSVDQAKTDFHSLLIWTKKIASQGLHRPDALPETTKELEGILRSIHDHLH